jgi:branched-chain amino acid transport system permease protein
VALAVAVFAGLALLLTASSAQAAGEQVRGRVSVNGQPLTGVHLVVTKDNGQPVGNARTQDGLWRVPLPGPGTYKVTLDQSSLPSGVKLLVKDKDTLTVTVNTGISRTLLFQLTRGAQQSANGGASAAPGQPSGGQKDTTVEWVQLLLEGIRFGLIIAITAIGLSLIFGTTGLTNFAHGELVTTGAIVTWYLNVRAGIQLIPATLIAMLAGALVGGLNDRLLWRPLRRRGTGLIAMLVISIGLSLFWRYVLLVIFGGRAQSYADYNGQRARDYGPVNLTDKDLASIVICIVVLVGVALLLQRSRIGKAMRAVSDNRDLASSSGINVDRVVLFVWMTGGALATLGGVLFGLSDQVQWQMGFQLLLLMFAGITLGGLGTAYGALLGSVIVGIFVQMSTLVVSPELKNVGGLLLLIVILVVRPSGILGSRQRIG